MKRILIILALVVAQSIPAVPWLSKIPKETYLSCHAYKPGSHSR